MILRNQYWGRCGAAAIAIVVTAGTLCAQQTPPPATGAGPEAGRGAGRGPGRGGGRGGPRIPPIDETGFQSIFDGKTLAGWDGDPAFWRVENGSIVGQTFADKQPKQNTFLIWRGGSPADFELKLQYKLIGHNSGIQIRSIELPDIKYAMKGYQADMDAGQQYTGQFYEERGRGFLAMRGQFSYIGEGGKPAVVGSFGEDAELKSIIKSDDWNDLHLIARGNTLIQILNGRITSMVVDDDKTGRKLDGLIGFQCHLGPPMTMEVKNVRLKKL